MSSVIEALIRLAGPLGPLGTLEERDRTRQELQRGDAAAQRLLDAVAAKPELPANVTREDFEGTAAEILAELADEPSARELLERSLTDTMVRGVAIDALGLSYNPLAGSALAALALSEATLTEDELVRVVSALGCVAGSDAVSALEELRARELPQAVRRELAIAIETVTKR